MQDTWVFCLAYKSLLPPFIRTNTHGQSWWNSCIDLYVVEFVSSLKTSNSLHFTSTHTTYNHTYILSCCFCRSSQGGKERKVLGARNSFGASLGILGLLSLGWQNLSWLPYSSCRSTSSKLTVRSFLMFLNISFAFCLKAIHNTMSLLYLYTLHVIIYTHIYVRLTCKKLT